MAHNTDTDTRHHARVICYQDMVQAAAVSLGSTLGHTTTERVESLLVAVLLDKGTYGNTTQEGRNALVALGVAAIDQGMAPLALADHYAAATQAP